MILYGIPTEVEALYTCSSIKLKILSNQLLVQPNLLYSNVYMRVKSQVIILRQFGMEFSLYNPLSIIMSRILLVEISCKRIRLTRICLMSAPSSVPRIKSTDASDEDMS